MNAIETAWRFLERVGDQDWEGALEFTQVTWRYGFDPSSFDGTPWRRLYRRLRGKRPAPVWGAEHLRIELEQIRIIGVEAVGRPRIAGALLQTVPAVVQVERIGREYAEVRRLALVKEVAPFRPSTDGTWGVNPTSVLKLAESAVTDQWLVLDRGPYGVVDMVDRRHTSS